MNLRDVFLYGIHAYSFLSLSSCATIISGNTADVWIGGKTERPVTIKTPSQVYENVTLPQIVEVKCKDLDKPILVSVDSLSSTSITPGSKVNGWYAANLLGFGIVGFLVDGLTGSANAPHKDKFYIDTTPSGDLEVIAPAPDTKQRKGQQFRQEIGLRFGFSSSLGSGRFNDLDGILNENGFIDDSYDHYFGPFALTGDYYYNYKQWAFGLSFSYAYGNKNYILDLPSIVHPIRSDKLQMKSWAVTPSARWYWGINIGVPWFYSRVSLGCIERYIRLKESDEHPQMLSIDEKKILFAYQVTPIGIDIGKGHFRFHAEFGYGIEGIVSVGMAYHY